MGKEILLTGTTTFCKILRSLKQIFFLLQFYSGLSLGKSIPEMMLASFSKNLLDSLI